jgi:hypothetical protein
MAARGGDDSAEMRVLRWVATRAHVSAGSVVNMGWWAGWGRRCSWISSVTGHEVKELQVRTYRSARGRMPPAAARCCVLRAELQTFLSSRITRTRRTSRRGWCFAIS